MDVCLKLYLREIIDYLLDPFKRCRIIKAAGYYISESDIDSKKLTSLSFCSFSNTAKITSIDRFYSIVSLKLLNCQGFISFDCLGWIN